MKEREKILSFDNLEIGYTSGTSKNILLPPLAGDAITGEMVAVIGRNGIGKSTFLRTLSRIQEPAAGKISYLGRNLLKYSASELSSIVGFISTEPVRVSSMRVYDLVSLGRYPYTGWFGQIAADDHAVIESALEKASIKYCSGKYMSELSDGERQKANIARLLSQDTAVMLMDEPTAFLDVRSKFEVFHLMYQLCHKVGKTVIYTTHDLSTAIRYSDKIWLMLDDGMKEGSPEDLMIKGEFDHLFESSSVMFNSSDGTWSFREETRREINIKGDEKLKHWTEEAMKRAGFYITADAGFVIEITGKPSWILHAGNSQSEHYSIYELVDYLSDLK